MAAIGSLVFCTACGNLLDGSSGDKKIILTCEICGTENKGIIQQGKLESLQSTAKSGIQTHHLLRSPRHQNLLHFHRLCDPRDQLSKP